ncbi:hypothetical protein CDL15_Pgr023353 [Punica granatum]|uniref:Tetraspanin-19 n=1 Tax=Punica granatum TaxID=22663 RepID=A0A218Y1Q7_PUNGR|nr:hypothetical protein CDL15_Pgr023353 [Punica granatum]
MARMVRSCMQSMLKLVNSVNGMVGIAMILYSVWMLKIWERHTYDLPFDDSSQPNPWFIYTFLGLSFSLCVITCFGHIAAETANGCCLYLYMFLVFLLLALEGAVTADVLLNPHWEQDFPNDLTGNLDQLTEFVRSNFDMFEWIGLTIVSVQGLCILLGLVLKALGPHPYYDSDDEFASESVPLLRDGAGQPSDSWSIRINEKLDENFEMGPMSIPMAPKDYANGI